MRFAIFDQMEAVGRPLHEVYADRLALLEAADEAGVWCYFKSEHHYTSLDTAPSISSWLATVAARTTSLRIGSLVYLLPFHHPIRLYEEIAMLDHLSGGRLEVGVGRGISPVEHEKWGLEPDLARDRSEETLDVLLAAFGTDALTYQGRFFEVDNVPLEVRPLQSPHPPMWYPGNIEVAGRRGFNSMTVGNPTTAATMMARFTELNEQHAGDPGRVDRGTIPSLGATIRILLDDDGDRALHRARAAWKHFDYNITKLWKAAGIHELPNNPSAGGDFDRAVDIGTGFAGTPEALAERIGALADVGVDPVMLCLDWGDIEPNESRRSLDLLAERVMPTFSS